MCQRLQSCNRQTESPRLALVHAYPAIVLDIHGFIFLAEEQMN